MSINGHGGNLGRLRQIAGKAENEILDFSANLNPLGFPDWLRPLISRKIGSLVHYPDPDNTEFVAAAARRYGAAPEEVIAGNGSTELLYLLAQVAALPRALIPVPAYSDYARAAAFADIKIESFMLRAADRFRLDLEKLGARLARPAAVFIGHPNNPTGQVCDAQRLRLLARAHPGSLFIVDEAFGDFVRDFDSLTVRRPANVAVLLSLTKMFAVPGLRLGCAVADASLVSRMLERQPPWSVNTLAQAAGARACQSAKFVARSQKLIAELRQDLLAGLQALPCLTPFPGAANFILIRIDPPAPAATVLAERLLKEHGIAIRLCANFEGLNDRFFRVAVRRAAENKRLLTALRRVLPGIDGAGARRKHGRRP
jgi:L-threonine-O-3-phosphate decarboxylase